MLAFGAIPMVEKDFSKGKSSPRSSSGMRVIKMEWLPLVCTNAAFLPFRVTQAPPDPPALLAKMAPRVFVATPAPPAVQVTPASKAPPAPPARRANPARTAPR